MSYASEVLADSPTVYYRLGEPSGTVAADQTGAHAGTYVNAPTLGVAGALAGDADTAATFAAASSQRVLSTTLGTLGANVATSTWAYWIKTTTTALGAVFGTLSTGTSLVIQNLLNSDASGALSVGNTQFFVRGTDGLQIQATISTNIYDGAYHFVVFQMSAANTFTVYVDGVSRTLAYNLQQTPTLGTNFEFPIVIGARNNRATIDTFANATVDEFAAYPTRLSASRVNALYAAGINSPNLWLPRTSTRKGVRQPAVATVR